MKVAFDASSLNQPFLSGMGVYMTNLFKELSKISDVNLQSVCKPSRWKDRRQMSTHLQSSTKLFLPYISGSAFDLYHGPDFKLPNATTVPRVVSIPDIAFFEDGMTDESFAIKKRAEVTYLLKKQRPEAVIVISEYTKQEVLKHFPEYKDRVHVTLLGHEHLITSFGKQQSLESEPYLLFVGNLEARKNVIRILKAYDQLLTENPSVVENLILIGRPGFGYNQIEQTLGGLKHKNRVKFVGYIENKNLTAYYQNATAFVYPSLIEGFGIPLLESMLHGSPVITANVTATAEVVGDSALTVDPLSVGEIQQAMAKILTDSDFRADLIKKGTQRVQEFTWAKCAEQTAQVYRHVLDK